MSESPEREPLRTRLPLLYQIGRSFVFAGVVIVVALLQPPGPLRMVGVIVPMVALLLYLIRLRLTRQL